MPHCPKCNSSNLRRSRTRTRWERWRKEITGKRLYRCRECQWRGWKSPRLMDFDATSSQDRSAIPEPPNLGGTLLARPERPGRIEPKELDRFHSPTDKDDA